MSFTAQPQTHTEVIHGLCSDCPLYDDLGGATSDGTTVAPRQAGICRKTSPHHVQVLDQAKVPDTLISGIRPGIWPIVRGEDWCGDHPLRQAAYQLGIEEMRTAIREKQKEAMKASRRAPPPPAPDDRRGPIVAPFGTSGGGHR